MPYCPNCRIQVAGNRCPNCGRVLAPPPPTRPQQPPAQRVATPPPPPARQPQYRQPAPTRTAYQPAQQRPAAYQPPPQRPVYYQQAPQQQAQPMYYQPTAPAAAPTAPPKKSRKGPVIAVIVVVVILVFALLAYLFILKPDEDGNGGAKTITYSELCNDVNIDMITYTPSFKSYDDGDVLNVVGTVERIRMANVPSGTTVIDPGPWTIIYFEEPGGAIPQVFNGFAYKGDLQSDYTIGQEATITIHIKEVTISTMTMEYPDEWMTATMLESYMEVPNIALQFSESTPGNYTGSVTSGSDIINLEDLEIEIYDASEDSTGYDDWDLTDDDPEEIDIWYSDLLLEFRDVNDDDKLDPGDTFMFYYAEAGDTITLIDASLVETITVYTIT